MAKPLLENENTELSPSDFENVIHNLLETSLDERVTFDNIFGIDRTVTMLKEKIVLPYRFPNLFQNIRQEPILLFGSPGSGKSIVLKAAANASNAKLFVFNIHLLLSRQFVSLIERIIQTIFKVAAKNAPSILCFEDLEVFDKKSELNSGRLIFYNEIHNFSSYPNANKVRLIGMTTNPWHLGAYTRRLFLRPAGSYVNLQNEDARLNHLKALCHQLDGHSLEPKDFQLLASKTHGFTGSDLIVLMKDASMANIMKVGRATHFKKILVKVETNPPSEPLTEDSAAEPYDTNEAERDCTSAECKSLKQEKNYSDSKENLKTDYDQQTEESKDGVIIAHDENIAGTTENETHKIDCDGDRSKKRHSRDGEVIEMATNEVISSQSKSAIVTEYQHSAVNNNSHTVGANETRSGEFVEKFIACEANDTGAIAMSVFDIPGGEENVYVEPLTIQDIIDKLSCFTPTVHEEETQKMLQFVSDFGTF